MTRRLHHPQFAVPPFPFLGERMTERTPLSPERRKGVDQDHAGSTRGIVLEVLVLAEAFLPTVMKQEIQRGPPLGGKRHNTGPIRLRQCA